MSRGERSCKSPCRTPEICSFEACSTECEGRVWDGETKADSTLSDLISKHGTAISSIEPAIKILNEQGKKYRDKMQKQQDSLSNLGGRKWVQM